MMILRTIFFLNCLLFTRGVDQNEMTDKKEDGLLQPSTSLTQSWVTERFSNVRFLVEDESLNELVVLRERRATGIPAGESTNGENECMVEGTYGSVDCGVNARCVKNMDNDNNTCICDPGFIGDGQNCSDINECLNTSISNCSSYAHCNNTDGSYRCGCKKGFYGNGKICNDTDECSSSNTCSTESHCYNSFGSYRCECKKEFYGNGKICEAILVSTIQTNLGETAVLVCTLNETVDWRKGGLPIVETKEIRTFKNLLVVKNVKDADLGSYTCYINAYNSTMTITLKTPEESTSTPLGYLIALVILAILLLVAIVVIAYLIYTRKKSPMMANETIDGGEDNEGCGDYEMVDCKSKSDANTSNNDNQDAVYSDLATERDQAEHTYQSLLKQNVSGSDTKNSDAANLYEPLDLDFKTKV